MNLVQYVGKQVEKIVQSWYVNYDDAIGKFKRVRVIAFSHFKPDTLEAPQMFFEQLIREQLLQYRRIFSFHMKVLIEIWVADLYMRADFV